MMSNAKHTPGPWKYERLSEGRFVVHNPSEEQHICETNVSYDNVAKANARLIAAAPDLLKALELMVAKLDESGRAWQAVEGRAAIAKAKGEA